MEARFALAFFAVLELVFLGIGITHVLRMHHRKRLARRVSEIECAKRRERIARDGPALSFKTLLAGDVLRKDVADFRLLEARIDDQGGAATEPNQPLVISFPSIAIGRRW